jgi:hypothetical protein
MLMAAGLDGAAVIGTDAVVSLLLGVIKIVVFACAGAITAQVVAVAL